MSHSRLRVLIAAGGSGGHLFPAQQLTSLLSDCEVAFAGHGLAHSPFFAKSTHLFWDIRAARPRRGNVFSFLISTGKGFWQSFSLLRTFCPDVVVGFGSYHTFPVLLMAAFLRKPMILFEANCVLGKVNRLMAPMAHRIAIQFPLEKPHPKGIFVPPVPWTTSSHRAPSQEEARAYFGLDPRRLTFLIFGGSQGAAFFNRTMPTVFSLLKNLDIQVVHFTGKEAASVFYGSIPSCIKPFETQMAQAYAAANIAICRSGAGTVAELICAELPALLVPFPHATDNHQWKNGKFLVHQVQGARMIEEKEATCDRMVRELKQLLIEQSKKKAALHAWNLQKRETTDFAALIRAVV